MAKQGQLVNVPHKMTSDSITVKQLADYLEPILIAAAGGSLNAYRSWHRPNRDAHALLRPQWCFTVRKHMPFAPWILHKNHAAVAAQTCCNAAMPG